MDSTLFDRVSVLFSIVSVAPAGSHLDAVGRLGFQVFEFVA